MNNRIQRKRSRGLSPDLDALQESNRVMRLLEGDLMFVEEQISAHPKEQRWRRIFVRSLFAFIEGCTYRLKQDAMGFSEFPTEELQVLKEKEYHLNEGGKISEGEMHIRILANLLYSFDAYGWAFNIDGALDIGDNRWDSLRKALKIRHRITHPKDFNDLVITDQEWHLIEEAEQWFVKNLINLIGKAAVKVGGNT